MSAGQKLNFFHGGSNFPRGSYFDMFPGKCIISKITVLNCYLAVNCLKPTPQSHNPIWHFYSGGRPQTTASRGRTPQPPINFTLYVGLLLLTRI